MGFAQLARDETTTLPPESFVLTTPQQLCTTCSVKLASVFAREFGGKIEQDRQG